MNPIVDRQFEELATKVQGAQRRQLPSGAVLITVPFVSLSGGWNKEQTTVRFLAPNGYPFAQPDCFWGDEGLALSTGLAPQATNSQAIPETNESGTWFSWHVQRWNPNKDSLLTFFRLVEQRLSTAQ
jgi:hypothetical protein